MGTKMLHGISVELTVEEQAEHDAAQAAGQEHQAAQAVIEAQKATDKANAKVKLKAAEYTPLTDDEVDALTK